MNTDRFVRDVLHGKDRGPIAFLLRVLLAPLALLHVAGLELYLLPYRLGLRQRYRLPVPTIAIGNLTSGGTGKTPMAALIAGRLQSAGKRVTLLSRGHRGESERSHTPQIVSDGRKILLDPDAAGDEPTLLATLLPDVPLIVGKDRRKTGALAVERFAPNVIVLDDALQFWQLHRDLDIVLLDAARPFDNGWVLPRGLLREPPFHLYRAGIIVLTRADHAAADVLERHLDRVRRLAPRAEVFTAVHAPIAWVRGDAGNELLPLERLAGRDVLAFSGIADGGAFVQSVEQLGARVVEIANFGDHHDYTEHEIADLCQRARRFDGAVTTEKDLVKIMERWRTTPGAPPLYALRIGMKIADPEPFWNRIRAALPTR